MSYFKKCSHFVRKQFNTPNLWNTSKRLHVVIRRKTVVINLLSHGDSQFCTTQLSSNTHTHTHTHTHNFMLLKEGQ